MGEVSTARATGKASVLWYTSGSVGALEARQYAETSGGIVTRGEAGLGLARQLRLAGWTGPLWLDPATYERAAVDSDLTLFGDRWAVAQAELRVEEPITPGSFVAAGDRSGLSGALRRESGWADQVEGARVSLALHAGWLTTDTNVVATELKALGMPVAVALADTNDPLGHAGAVAGLVQLVREVPDLMLLRCDLGSVGGVANGARSGAIGTSTTVRHFVPPGRTGGGVPGDRTPSVFIPSLLTFKLGSFLEQLPRRAVPVCDLACCLGARLSRFNDERMVAEARVHNRLAFQLIVDNVLACAPAERTTAFRAMCQQAISETQALEVAARRPIEPPRQLHGWAQIS
jgi:hypothetical protein